MNTFAHLCQFCSVPLRMRSVSDKSCRGNQNTHFIFNKCGMYGGDYGMEISVEKTN